MNVENTATKQTTSNNTVPTAASTNHASSDIKLNLQTIIKIFLQTYKINIEELF